AFSPGAAHRIFPATVGRFRPQVRRHGKCPSSRMKQFITYSLVIGGLLVSRGLANADHDKDCKNIHGKVTVVTADGITVNDKMYKVGKTTRIKKGDQVVKLEKISVGDMVCLDARGK